MRHTDLVHDSQVLDMGLLALKPYFDPNGVIERIPAIDTLIERMSVLDFIRQQTYYSDPRRAVTQILRGLVNYQFLTRWTYGDGTKRNKKSPTTRAFLITPKGRDRLKELNSPIAPVQTSRPSLAVETIPEPVAEPVPNGNVMARVEQEAATIQPLMEKHDSLIEDLAAYEDFLGDNENQSTQADADLIKINSQIKELQKEQARIITLLEEAVGHRKEAEKKIGALQQERESFLREIRDTSEKIARLKEQIRTILYPNTPNSSAEKSAPGA